MLLTKLKSFTQVRYVALFRKQTALSGSASVAGDYYQWPSSPEGGVGFTDVGYQPMPFEIDLKPLRSYGLTLKQGHLYQRDPQYVTDGLSVVTTSRTNCTL